MLFLLEQLMLPWIECPALSLDLDVSLDDRVAMLPDDVVQRSQELLAAVQAEISGGKRWLADAVHLRTRYRFLAETKTNARRVGVDWRDLTLANLNYELVVGMFACSTIVLPTATGPVLARNMDFWPEKWLARASVLLRFTRGGQLQFVNAGWPAAIGAVSGLSARGFAIVLNAVGNFGGLDKLGYPVLLYLRRVLEEAENFDAAVERLSSARLMAGALFTVAGTDNHQRVVIERTPTKVALRRPHAEEPLITTNDYRMLHAANGALSHQLLQTSCLRYDALCRFFMAHQPTEPVDDARLLYALTDPSVKQSITAQHMIFRPRDNTAQLFAPRDLVCDDEITDSIVPRTAP